MKDTPRTDERKASFALDTIRQLETELAAARKGIAKLKEQYTPWWARKRSEIDKLREVTEQRDRLAEAMTRIKTIYENPEKRCIPSSSDMYDEAIQSLTPNEL